MSETEQVITAVADEIGACLRAVRVDALEGAVRELTDAPRIFLAGAGRSALGIRGFAMRLMHLGKDAHVVGEVTTPSTAKGDLLVIGSGSGRTESLLAMASKAKKIGVRILLLTIDPGSPIGELADCILQVPAPSTKAKDAPGAIESIQPMGSLFEQTLFVLCDAMIVLLMRDQQLTSDEMFKRHANLE